MSKWETCHNMRENSPKFREVSAKLPPWKLGLSVGCWLLKFTGDQKPFRMGPS